MTFCGLLTTTFTYGQEPSVSNLLDNLSEIRDQYNENFDPGDVGEKITLIFVEGSNTVFSEIYAKFKGKKLAKNVWVIAGWKDVMPDTAYKSKFKHMTDGFKSKEGLGDDAYAILFDLNSNSLKLLGLKKYSVVTLYKTQNKLNIQDFGSNRVEFLKAIRKYFS